MNYSITADLGSVFGDTSERLFHHTGDAKEMLNKWRKLLNEAWPGGLDNVRKHAPTVMKLIGHPRMLFHAASVLRAGGPKAAGLNGVRLEQLSNDELHDMSNALGKAIATDTYRPPLKEKVSKVPKASGVGKRKIVVMDAQQRVLHEAAAKVLRPLLDPTFDPLSFGFRSQRGREHAIAVAEILAKRGNTVWLVHDLKDAFGRVPVQRLLDMVFKMLPCPRLRDFLKRVLPPASRSLGGIKQGSPISPLMLMTYLSKVLHEPWRTLGLWVYIISYADDLGLMAKNLEMAEAADIALRKLLAPAGMLLKASFSEAVRDIREQPAEWLGFQFRMEGKQFQIRLRANAFTKLGRQFDLAHAKSLSTRRAYDLLKHWFGQLGPCYRWEDRKEVIRLAFEVAAAHGFTETPRAAELERHWRASHDRWQGVRRHVRKTPGYLVEGPIVPPMPTSVVR